VPPDRGFDWWVLFCREHNSINGLVIAFVGVRAVNQVAVGGLTPRQWLQAEPALVWAVAVNLFFYLGARTFAGRRKRQLRRGVG
jgi:hypothetical protein